MDITAIDLFILDFIREHISNPVLNPIAIGITWLGEYGIVPIVLTIIMLCTKRFRKMGIAMAIAIIIGFVVGNLTLKPIIARVRPYDLNDVSLIVPRLKDFSFPSAHTMITFCVSTAMVHYRRKIGITGLVLAGFVGLSRLYLYVHYPSDVIVGCIMGIAFGIIAVKITEMLFKKFDLDKKLHIYTESKGELEQ